MATKGTIARVRGVEQYAPFLRTKNFDIFHHRVVRNPRMGLPRSVFTAWFREFDVPRPVCTVTIWDDCPYGAYVEWVYVCEQYRRTGVATEVITALEKELGCLHMSGATTAGKAFVRSLTPAKKVTKKKKAKRVTRKAN